MILNTLKWASIGLVSSYIFASVQRQTTLGSLQDKPMDIYSPEFYPNGTYLELPQGTMRYWQFGNEGGKRVVLVHGISTGSAVYDKLARDLAENGHHVLVYDLWGRGYSQAPPAKYNEALYTSQLAMLLQKVGWDKTDVIGVSLGGAIATSFTAFYPEIVNKLVLIAPTGAMKKVDMPFTSKVIQFPFVYQYVTNQPYIKPALIFAVQRFAKSTRSKQAGLDEDTTATIEKITKIATYQFVNHAGFLRAFLGTIVDFPFTELRERYRNVGRQGDRSVLLIWGDKDTTVPFYHHQEVQELMPNTKLIVYKDQGHDVLISRWRSVNKDIQSFLE